jgi:ATP-dependent Clp protease adaptor protein ClpS
MGEGWAQPPVVAWLPALGFRVQFLEEPTSVTISSAMTAFSPPAFLMSDNDKPDDDPATGVVVKAKPKTRKPSMYKVLMLNDDYTPMEFVVHVLERFFSKNREEAQRIMLHVHRRGVGICGVFTYEVAESKVTQVMDFARQHQHPLQCTLEKE